MTTTAFTIDVEDERLQLLQERLAAAVWPEVPDGTDGHGIAVTRVRELVEHWRTRFDWRRLEEQLNRYEHVLEHSGQYALHLIHQRAAEPSGVPVVLVHGWPDAFLRYRKLIGPLVRPVTT